MKDVVVVGGGPAGLTATLYAERAKLNVTLFEKKSLGGQILNCDIIENYPGVLPLSGSDLVKGFIDQLSKYSPEISTDHILSIDKKSDGNFLIKTKSQEIMSKSVIVCSGAKPRVLGVKGEESFAGKGVSYCAICDGPFFAGLDVVVVGGGDTAVKEAIYLSKLARKVYVVHRRDEFRAEKIYAEKLQNISNVDVLWSTVVEEINGEDTVKSIVIKDLKTELFTSIDVQGVFMFVGIVPVTDFVDCEKDESGFIKTSADMSTSVSGLYAAGDCRTTFLRQVSTAVGDAATAAISVQEYTEY